MLELLPVGRVSSFTVLPSNMTGRNIRTSEYTNMCSVEESGRCVCFVRMYRMEDRTSPAARSNLLCNCREKNEASM